MKLAVSIFIELIKSEICATIPDPELMSRFSKDIIPALVSIAGKHDLTHVLAVALKKQGLLGNDKLSVELIKLIKLNLIRYEAVKYTQDRLYDLFESNQIAYVPLKGAVIREFYSEPWMRLSCDIDILVKEEDLHKAKGLMIHELNYSLRKFNYHDVSLYSPEDIHVELHFRITENEEKIDGLLNKVWDYVVPVDNSSYRYEMTPEYLLFHSYAHMYYHFVHGGCGVKYVSDLFVLKNRLDYDETKLNEMLQVCGIDTFAKQMDRLVAVWFSGEVHDDITKKIQTYIIDGGLFGSTESKIVAGKTKTESNFKYYFQRVFMPYKEFCASYPKMEKYPILYPFYTVKRWFKIFDRRKAKDAVKEISINQKITQDSVDELKSLFKELKL